MKRLLLILILLLTTSKVSLCQSTLVSGTITDAGGQAWIGGTYTFTSAALGQVPITGTLDGSGAFTSLTFPHNSFTSAVGDVWTARICPDATAPCYTKTVTISGATQSLSTTLIPAAISISIPFFPAAITTLRAYADAEIVSTPKGGQYFNTISGTQRQCTAVTGTTCNTWVTSGGGGTASLLVATGATSGSATVGAADVAGTPSRINLPTATGASGQCLQTDGGNPQQTSWQSNCGLAILGVPTNAQTGASYAVGTGDRASYVTFSNAGAIAVTLPQAGSVGFASNFVFVACDIGAGTATITPTVSTISYTTGLAYVAGAASMPITTGQCAWIYSDNTNYFAIQRTGGAPVYPFAVSGTVNSGGIPYFSSATQQSSSAVLTANLYVKGGGAGVAPAPGLTTDDGTTSTYTGTGGTKSPAFTATGTTAGFFDYPQGSTSAGVSPCNTANSWCVQAPAAVTAGVETQTGVHAQGIPFGVGSSSAIQDGTSGDANYSTTVTIGSGADIAATLLCSTANCPAGTYRVNIYINLTTPCGTTGTFIPWLGYTDDSGARTGSSTTTFFDIQGTGAVPATGTLTTTSTANYGQATYILRTTGAATGGLGSINYGATRTACGSAGPMVGKMYLSVEPLQ